MFFVYVPFWRLGCSIRTNTFVVDIDIPLESATYNWPCEKTCWGKYKPTFWIVWPWALFIVIAKQRRTGNYFRMNLNGYPSFSGADSWILGRNTCFVAEWPLDISACRTFWEKPRHIIRVPLHKPLEGSKFLSNMMGAFSFNSNLHLIRYVKIYPFWYLLPPLHDCNL